MPLSYILAEIAASQGYELSVPDEKSWLINQTNRAAKEIYESKDLTDALREQIISFTASVDATGNTVQLAALPYYVGKLRAIRNYYTRRKVDFHDMRPRYKSDGWTENLLAFRQRYRSAIQRDVLNAAPLTLTIGAPEMAEFAVIISGSTANAARVTESITFAVGDVSKSTVNSFVTIDSISNVTLHAMDVTVTDLDGNVLAVLVNDQFRSEYLIVQILDYVTIAPANPYIVEILYKPVLAPLSNDGDEFQCSGYDDAIIWQTLGNLKAKSEPDQAALAFTKVRGILRDRSEDEEQGIEKTIDFVASPTLGLYDYPRYSTYPRGPFFPGAYTPWP